MATMPADATHDPQIESIESKYSAAELAAFNLFPGSQILIKQIDWGLVPIPQRILVRELTINGNDPRGPILYRDPTRPHPCDSLDDITQMAGRVRTNNYTHLGDLIARLPAVGSKSRPIHRLHHPSGPDAGQQHLVLAIQQQNGRRHIGDAGSISILL